MASYTVDRTLPQDRRCVLQTGHDVDRTPRETPQGVLALGCGQLLDLLEGVVEFGAGGVQFGAKRDVLALESRETVGLALAVLSLVVSVSLWCSAGSACPYVRIGCGHAGSYVRRAYMRDLAGLAWPLESLETIGWQLDQMSWMSRAGMRADDYFLFRRAAAS